MSEREKPGILNLHFIGKAWLVWLATAAVLLPVCSLLICRTSASERTMAHLGSALVFVAACAAGMQAMKQAKGAPLIGGLLCACFLVLPLLLCGFLIDSDGLSTRSALSVASLSFAGALFGSVILCGHSSKGHRRHAAVRPQERKGKR